MQSAANQTANLTPTVDAQLQTRSEEIDRVEKVCSEYLLEL